MVTPCAKPGKLKYNGSPCLRFRRRTTCRNRLCRSARVPPSWRRCGSGLDPNPHRPALQLIDFEGICLSHKIAQLAGAVGSRIEIGSEVGKPFSDFTER